MKEDQKTNKLLEIKHLMSERIKELSKFLEISENDY